MDYPVQTLNNGIPFEEIKALSRYKPGEITQSIIPGLLDRRVIVQVGSIDQNKNHIFTLKTLKKLKPLFPDILYLIVGTGNNQSLLQEWVRSNNLESEVKFAGRLDRMDCLYLISRSDILVLTSYSEAFPNVLVEAQATSIPVVTFDVGGASEIVKNFRSGFVVNVGDSEAFNASIVKLLQNSNLRREMGQNGRDRVLKHFTLERKVNKLLSQIYHDMATLSL